MEFRYKVLVIDDDSSVSFYIKICSGSPGVRRYRCRKRQGFRNIR